MRQIKAAIAGILSLFAVATATAQQFPTVPSHSVIGRLGLPGDNGPSQAIPFATLSAALGNTTTVLAAKAKCDGSTDDAPVIQKLINATAAAGGGTIVFPASRTCVIASSLVISSSGIILRGQGRDASTINYTGTGFGIVYNNSIENIGIIDLTISSSSTTNTLIKISAVNVGFTLERSLLKGGGIQMLVTSTDASVGGSYSIRCINSGFQSASLPALKFAPLGNGLAAANNVIGCDFSGFKTQAIYQTNGSALYVDHSHIERHLGTGATASAVHVDTSNNTTFSHIWFEDDSNNPIIDIGNDVGNFAVRDSIMQLNVAGGTHTSAGALNVSGTGCKLISIENVHASIGGTIGPVWNTGSCPVYGRANGFDSGTATWGFASTATSAQVDIDDTVQGATATTFTSGIQQIGVSRMAADGSNGGIKVGTTALTNGTSTRVLYDNAGVLGEYTTAQLTAQINAATASLPGALPAWPNNTTTYFRGDGTYQTHNFASLGGALAQTQAPTGGTSGQYWQTNGLGTATWASHKNLIGWASLNTLTGNATGFFTNNACQATEANCAVPVVYAGTAKRISVTSQIAPGAGNSYVITLRLNAVDTALTCTISGAAQTACQSTGTVAVAADQTVDFKVVASTSAGTSGFAGSIEIDTP